MKLEDLTFSDLKALKDLCDEKLDPILGGGSSTSNNYKYFYSVRNCVKAAIRAKIKQLGEPEVRQDLEKEMEQQIEAVNRLFGVKIK